MADPLEIHDVATDRALSSAEFQEILAGGSGPVAFQGDAGVDLAAWSSGLSDVTVFVANPGASGRGSADLLARLWREFPETAALLHDHLASVGAVVFSEKSRAEARESAAEAADPIGMAVARAISRGESLQAIVDSSGDDLQATEPPVLGPGQVTPRGRELGRVIAEIPPERLVPAPTSPADAHAILAGLLLWHDLLDESHFISQSIESQGRHVAGDYWHAIMHRREPDYGNAKYWFRRAGTQPIFMELAERAGRHVAGTGLEGALSGGKWDSAAFVDACQEVARSGNAESELALRRCQADEMLLLLEQTCRDAAS